MSELRWHPLLEQWVVVASHRQDRPQMPADWCPFCPGAGNVPPDYDVLLYPNDFPAFDLESAPFVDDRDLFGTTGARGTCDVILYSPRHTLPPSQLTAAQWLKVIQLWSSRSAELGKLPDIQYIMPFENTGEAIGVTMPHPHGQMYAFPFLPPLAQQELDSSRKYFDKKGECLYCALLAGELEQQVRLVTENGSFVAFVPFAARFPSEIQLYPRRHFGSLPELTGNEAADLADILSTIRKKYDNLYGFLLPLMMAVRLAPAKGEHPYFHFHIEFLPIQRSAKKLKYLAAVESAAGTYLADTKAEERAAELRKK
ncbi:MAG: galactose-1-phosphate uridylyltransferase [Bryobacteraceae bacterium]